LALVEDPAQVGKIKAIAEVLSALCAAAALDVTRIEFEQIAGFAVAPKKSRIASLGDTLRATGCKMALVEDPEATAKMMARANKRQRALRVVPQLPAPT
jgi:hypothetical protein